MSDKFAQGDISAIPGITLLNVSGLDIDKQAIIGFVQNHGKEILTWFSDSLSGIAGTLGSGVWGLFGKISTAGFVFAITFFLALERKEVYHFCLSLLPSDVEKKLKEVTPDVDRLLLTWIRGQFLLSCSIFVATYVGLYILEWVFGINIRGHFSLAFIAAICELVPVIGPIIASIPALIIALSLGPVAVGAVAIMYFMIQEIENLFLVPRIQGHALDLSNFTVLVSMALAGSLFGLFGVLFTLPVLAILKIVFFPQNTSK